MTAEGQAVTWVRSFLPESSRTPCYFEAAGAVAEARARAEIPFARISPAVETTPESL